MLKRTMLIIFTLGGMLSISYAFYNINLSASGINYQAGGNVNGRVNIAPANISAQNSGLRRGDKFYLNVKNPATNDKLGWILAGADVGISGIVLTTEGITQPIAASAKPTVATTTFYRDTNLPLVMDPFIANMQSVDQDFLLERDVSGLENLADIQANYSPWPSDVGYVQYVTTKDYITGKSPFLLGDPADTVWTTSSPNVPANKRTFPAPYDLTFDDLLCTFDYWMPYSGIQPTGTRYNQWGVISTTSSYPQPYTNLATVRPAAHITLGNIVFALSQGSQSGYAMVGTPIVGSGNLCLAAAQDETMKLRVADPSLSISFNAIKNKNQAVVGKVVENGSVYLAVDANAGTNHTVSALIFDASGEFKYYLPLEPAKGNDLYELDVKGIPLGVYSISVVNEVYDETDMRPASSSRLSNALPLEIVTGHELQYTNTPQGGNDYEYGKNVTIGATVGSIALNPVGFPPITYKMESDGDQTYQNFEISGLDSNGASSATLLNVKVKAGGPDLANGGLKAGTYKFCISSNDANGYPDVQIPNKTKICTSFVVKKTSINSVVFDQPNQTIKTITEASTNWYEPASANPAHGIKITYSIAGGDIGLIDIDPDSGAISYKGKGAYGKVKIKASADDDPSTGYDNNLPAYAEKEIVIVREVDGVVIPDQASSDKDIPTFSSDKANIKTNGVIGKIQGTLGAPDTIGGSVTTYTYAMKAGGDSNFFTVNTNSGEIKTNANLAVGSYTFTVTVSDKWSSKDIPVTVNVGMAPAEALNFYENSTSNTIINQKTV
ncbi:MAG: cadherin repeat domain-containing protein, partial [Erysipelotrichaceae bacterium]|nr:cadherin repeat domain-containing protein [Erysipelotrichaceae bacterium]